jgi:hypothetical protein
MSNTSISESRIEVKHVRIESAKPFAEVERALNESVPTLDMGIAEALAKGNRDLAKERAHGSPLFIFSKRDHGAILKSFQQTRHAIQCEIGNPITASSMTQYQLPAALYAPLRVLLYQNESGGSVFEYDLPSTLFGQFGDEEVTAVGRDLDAELRDALMKAAAQAPRGE